MPVTDLPTITTVLTRLIDAAQNVLMRPALRDRSAELADLRASVAATIAQPAAIGIVGEEAALLVTTLIKASAARMAGDDETAMRWEQLAGALLPWVRRDFAVALDARVR